MRSLRKKALLLAAGAAAFCLPQTQAGSFTANFNDNATPAGSSVNGNNGDNASGVIEGGVLKITKNVNGKSGGFVIDDLDAGAPVYGLTFTAKVRVGGGTPTPADGFSLNFAPDINLDATGGEEGIGSGIRIAFDEYVNTDTGETTPTIDLKLGNTVIASVPRTTAQMRTDVGTTPTYADVSLTVAPDGALTLVYKGETIFNHIYFAGYQGLPSAKFAIVGRTGGLNENFWFDDISLTTVTTPQVGIVTNPNSQTVLAGSNATFAPVLNNVEGATFQWLKNGSPITGATEQTYTLNSVSATDNNTKYSLRVTGPNNTVTTTEGTLTVVTITLPPPTASFNFESPDGTPPAGTTLFGSETGGGYISTADGVNTPGILHLTDAATGQRGGIIIDDLAAGAPVYGIAASFKARVGGGTATPADGFSFNFANDIPATPGDLEYENGIGTGLTIGFDIYDNGGGEAPSVDVRYGGSLIAQQKVPMSFLDTGDGFTDVIIRLEDDGTLDVAYKGVILFNNLTIPGFSQITGGKVAIGARTGDATENQWIDDLNITTDTTAGDLRITTQPVSRYVIAGQELTLTSAVNDETGVTYQWLRNGTPISGATSANYTFTAQAGDNNAQYSVRVTRGGLTATSNPATLTVLSITPTVSYDFNTTTTPAGTLILRNPADSVSAGYISANGGVADSGVLHLTDNVNGQQGAFVVQPLLGGAEVAALNVAFDVLVGGGTQPPADGFSFNWAPDLTDTIPGVDLENGAGNGLTIGFDIFDNAGGEGPSIDIKWKGATLVQTKLTSQEIQTSPDFRKVIIKVSADGKVDVVYGDRVIYNGYQLPNYAPITNGKYAFYARTGGLNGNQWIDNVQIQAIKSTAPLRIVDEPADVAVLPGQTATFTAVVSDPTGVTYQWFRNNVPISGATSSSYTTPALGATDSASYSVTVTGPGGTATSRQAVATVVPVLTIGTPDVVYHFDGADPEGASLFPAAAGGGYISADGGINNSGALHLTDDAGSQGGSFFVPAFDNGETVSAFTANFKLLMRANGTPADGISFVWANDVTPSGVFGEEGIGSGLTISIDTYNNGGGEAPAFDLVYKGVVVSSVKVPISRILTGSNFGDVTIRVENDGTLDMQYNGQVIFNNVQLPNFEPLANAYFALGGRTGGASADQWIDELKLVTTSGAAAPNVGIARNTDGSLTITWAGAGTLQAAPSVTGPWTNLTGVTSPATVQPTGTMQFFRVAQ